MPRVADSRTKQNYVAMLLSYVANIHTQWRYTFMPTCFTKHQGKVTLCNYISRCTTRLGHH